MLSASRSSWRPVVYVPPSPPTWDAVIAGLKAAASEAKLTAPFGNIDGAPHTSRSRALFHLFEGNDAALANPDAADSAREPSIFYQPPPSSSEPRVVYLSVFFDNDVYTGTRQSLIMEACEAQQFTPVDLSPPPAPPKSHHSANSNWCRAGADHSRLVLSLVGLALANRYPVCCMPGMGRGARRNRKRWALPTADPDELHRPIGNRHSACKGVAADALLAQSTKADLAPAVGHRKTYPWCRYVREGLAFHGPRRHSFFRCLLMDVVEDLFTRLAAASLAFPYLGIDLIGTGILLVCIGAGTPQ